MHNKIKSCIISVFLFTLSLPQTCFAQLGEYLAKEDAPEISCAVSKAVNVLDVSGRIAKTYYDGTRDFFFNIYVQNSDDNRVPVYNPENDNIVISVTAAALAGSKKELSYARKEFDFTGLFDNRMRGSPPGRFEITKLYLLSIEALQKGSVPVFAFITDKNILL